MKFWRILKDPYLLLALLLCGVFMLPFINNLPYRDGNIDFVWINQFMNGGFAELFSKWNSIHPPFKVLFFSLVFNVFGVNTFSYNLPGILFAFIGIFSVYSLMKSIFNIYSARISALLLASSPLFITSGIYSSTDFLLANFSILTFALYFHKKYLLSAIAASLCFLIKEQGILVVISILLVEVFILIKYRLKDVKIKNPFNLKILFYLLPFVSFFIWSQILKHYNSEPWNDYIFASTKDKGSVYTVFYNLISFNFINKFAIQNWQQFFLMNFNWIYWSLIVFGVLYLLWNLKDKDKLKIKEEFSKSTQRSRTLLVIFFFFIIYIISVLSFQTYTIPRYAAPMIPIFTMILGFIIYKLSEKSFNIKLFFGIFFPIIILFSLFSSIDPVTKNLFGKSDVLGQDIYSLDKTIAGNDGITYNLQFHIIGSERSKLMRNANASGIPVFSYYCSYIFADPNNDPIMMDIFSLNKFDGESLCLEKEF